MENSKDKKKVESFKMKGDWKDQSKKLKTKYAQLTNDDLKYVAGKENDLLKRVEDRLKKTREEVISIIKKVQPVKV